MISYDVKVFNKLECVILTTVPFTYLMYQIRISGSIDLSPKKNKRDICVRYGHHGQGGNPDRLIDKSIS